ncbi:alpha/beta hydrolase [Adlercreutzia aquisgranensis]|uniref:alpha/beta hydrolase n=1 Tax=Adlercreutzia aquisgranensis TaxID=2941323 RepID=UPI0020425356|nr:alpha/beta hydrolase [Adlercreutzia aquisgranensis]
MSATVVVEPVEFPSSDCATAIHGCLWSRPPADGADAVSSKPRALIQIVHGMQEHIGRYDEFARFLVGQGFAVCAEDHVGHGKSAASPDDLGHMGPEAKEQLVEDVQTLRRIALDRVGCDVPYVVFGHSMGSFITRAFLARHGEGVRAAVICGTGNMPVAVSRLGNLAARAIARVKGQTYRSPLLESLVTGGFGRAIPDARTPLDWLSTDPAVVEAFRNDPLAGAPFSAGAYAALTDLTAETASLGSARRIPSDLPVLFIAGSEDPVGERGKAVRAAASLFERAGVKDVTCIIYDGMRHEILNEPGRQRVYADVVSWIEKRL